jgi:hypothetical protein
MRILTGLLVILQLLCAPAYAQDKPAAPVCKGDDKPCLLALLRTTADGIAEDDWRDSTYRELAKLLAAEKQTDQAVALVPLVKNPDTKAMTIRGIGMAAANLKLDKAALDALFAKLTAEAGKITDPPSHAIALTYVAMSQAFAGDNDGAMKTAAGMENAALRNKAYNEAAKIQADRGDMKAATASIDAITDKGFRDKAYKTISGIFADNKAWDQALAAARKVGNPYQQSEALLYMLYKQIKPAEVSIE